MNANEKDSACMNFEKHEAISSTYQVDKKKYL